MVRFKFSLIGPLVVFAATAVVTLAQDTPKPYQSPGTRRMAERLAKMAKEADPTINAFISTERVALFRKQLASAVDPDSVLQAQERLANELLNAGQPADALKEYQVFLDRLKEFKRPLHGRAELFLMTQRAICNLRIGEQDNCISGHHADSCLMPIRGGGVHLMKEGSRAAVDGFSNVLRRLPSDLKARWLMNIAYMTLGEYPANVPEKFLIPPSAFASEYDIKTFPNVASGAGLEIFGNAGGVVADDFDGDGLLDLMVSTMNMRGQLRLFRSNGDGTFSDRTAQAGLTGEIGGLNLIQTDFNNDGWTDVLVLRGAWFGAAGRQPNSLLRNNGNGTFDDVTEEAGLLSFRPTQTAVWFDYNQDGWLDLFIGNESGVERNPCELFRNNGDGTFTECAAEAGVAHIAYVKGVSSADYDGDGRPDLYLSCRSEANVLFHNDGPRDPSKGGKSAWKFTDMAAKAGVTQPISSFPTWFFDYDNDGWPDIFVAGYSLESVGDIAAEYLGLPHKSERARLYRNNRDGTFTDATKEVRLDKILHGMGANFGDLDNDGWLDFYVGTGDPDFSTLIPNRMFRNGGGKFFQEVTTSGGFGHLQKGHGIAFADFDNDGDQDVFEVIGGAYTADTAHSVLFKNPGHSNRWITLKLEGNQSNLAAIGARIKVTVNEPTGRRDIYKTVGSGGSFGASPLRQEIGLGQASSIEQIEIRWPRSGQTQVLTGLKPDQFYRVAEGEKVAAPWALTTFKLPDKSEAFCMPPGLAKATGQ